MKKQIFNSFAEDRYAYLKEDYDPDQHAYFSAATDRLDQRLHPASDEDKTPTVSSRVEKIVTHLETALEKIEAALELHGGPYDSNDVPLFANTYTKDGYGVGVIDLLEDAIKGLRKGN